MAAGAAAYAVLRASLPALDGTVTLAGPGHPVRIERDALGVPTLAARSREDLAFATGFLHAQERFFQMDLQRRAAAGELAELFGPIAVSHDRQLRNFRFRHIAAQVLAAASPEQRALLAAYARGANAGLAALGSRPWEYWLLRARPAPWRAEDSVLVVHAMWWDLQGEDLGLDRLRHALDARLGGPLCADGWKCALHFWLPARTDWDAPIDVAAGAAAAAPAPIPGPEALDLRRAGTPPAARDGRGGGPGSAASAASEAATAHAIGSNNWAVAGRLSASGAALVASDMHLSQRVPIIWYRARLKLDASAPGGALDLAGATLPGAPLVVAGSNGHIAWGFTNSYGTWSDVYAGPCPQQGDPGWQVALETIRVQGAEPQQRRVTSGPPGLLLAQEGGQCWFAAWLALSPGATNLNLMGLERADTVQDALALAPTIGIPHQNLVVGDREGHIAWTIAGRIPKSVESRRALAPDAWSGPGERPQVVDPPLGRIWTANARVISDGAGEQLLGADAAALGAGYALGARARQIRDDLLALQSPAKPADMLKIQLDDRALFLTRWRDLALELAGTAGTPATSPLRSEARRLLTDWSARASTDSAAYRLVREFRARTRAAVWLMLLKGVGLPPDEFLVPMQFEQPLWQLLQARPPHLLAPPWRDWPGFLAAQLDATLADLAQECGALARCTWGAHNTVRIAHPLSRALPGAARWLDMPVVQLPGDDHMPRVQIGEEGASERFAVSPGHEGEGYFHMPGGQSGHPLSPYYRAGFMAWARGEPLPFLPGPAIHLLELSPATTVTH